jgi:hypothetical protein
MCSEGRAGLDEVDKYAATHWLKDAGGNRQHRGKRCGVADCHTRSMAIERAKVLRTRELIHWLTLLHSSDLQAVAFVVVPAIVVIAGVRVPPAGATGDQDVVMAARRALGHERQPQISSILDCYRVTIPAAHGVLNIDRTSCAKTALFRRS